jgi:hypothetical protein
LLGFARPADLRSLAPEPDGPVRFTLAETVGIVEDLVRIADGLQHDDREVDAYLIDFRGFKHSIECVTKLVHSSKSLNDLVLSS